MLFFAYFFLESILSGKIAGCFSACLAIRRCQPDADSAFVDLEAQAALLVIIGLLAQIREFGGIGQQPLFQLGIVGVDLCGKSIPSS